MDQALLDLGAVAIVFALAIREFFSYLRTRRNGNGHDDIFSKAILEQLQTMNSNHLHSIQQAIEDGNKRLVDVIHKDNMAIIELLGEIKGMQNK